MEKEIIALGVEARQFLDSKLFSYIIETAEIKKEAAMRELCYANAECALEIREYQNIIQKYEDFENWLVELVQAGDTAYEQYLEGSE